MERLSNEVKDRFGINDPFKIAHQKDIAVVAEPLGKIHGYMSDLHGQKIIHINDGLHPSVMEYVTSYLLSNEFVDGFHNRFCIQKSYDLWNVTERQAHKFANHLLDRNCNTVLERLNQDEILEITTMLDRIWCKDTMYCKRNAVDKLYYVLLKFI